MKKLVVIVMVLAILTQANLAGARYELETVATDLDIPWSMVWLPDGDMLVSERSGEILRFRDGIMMARLTGVPQVQRKAQGGLLDLALHPDFTANQFLYMSYSDKSGDGKGSNTAIARARLVGNALTDFEVIYKGAPNTTSGYHFGSRIVFDGTGHLLFSIGDRGKRDVNPQDPGRDGGKIYRLHDDGTVPDDNPFVDSPGGAVPAVYSLGHRNPQGMAVNPLTDDVWTHEHGPRGGDEVNIIKAGANYGWPILSYGINYSGTKFAEGTERKGYASPIWHWVPSIAPSGMTFVTSDKYPDWQGHLLVGALKDEKLVLCHIDGEQITRAETVLDGIGRVRDVRQGPDGFVYIAIDDLGIQRIRPAS